ncbi:PEP-CTERM sorting domain-containing protein [Rubritalea sp.]|uniref:PEP-CTERM sorting domain-containing protein n=1 Tax=Rubritalea sp. TaxID=2109375 RepID=UPI003EF9488A
MKLIIPFLSCFIAGYAHSAAVITEAIFDPGAVEFTNHGNLELTGSQTLTFNMVSGALSYTGQTTAYTATTVATNYSSSPQDSYFAFVFENFVIGKNVTIDVIWGNTPPPAGLAILATGNFTLEAELSYSDPAQAQAYDGGNISLVSRGDMILNSVISSDGAVGKGSNKNGRNGGIITIATGSNLDASGAAISSNGGDGAKTNSNDGGNGGVIDIYAKSITGIYDDIAISAEGGTGKTNGNIGSEDDFTGISFPSNDLDYLTTNFNNSTTTAIPEPSSSAMLMLGGLGFLSRRKRKST